MTPKETLLEFVDKACAIRKRSESITKLINRIWDQPNATVIETGCTHRADSPDGRSTEVFARLAKERGFKLISIDSSEECIGICKGVLGELVPFVELVHADSVVFLSCFNRPIHVLYLDSQDYWEPNPLSSQVHQLAELGAAYGKLTADAVVVLDDCELPWGGKATMSTAFLMERKWCLIHNAYQRVFVRKV